MALTQDAGVLAAVDAAGSIRRLSIMLGINHQSVMAWTKIPVERLDELEQLLSVPRHVLRPDLFRGYVPQRRHKPRKLTMAK